MADQQTQEMISAYAAGCLDVDNFINFKEYLVSGGDLPQTELGELQNVMSLLALTLEEETPPAQLKGRVAKKLISLKGEIKAKLKAEKSIIEKEIPVSKKDEPKIQRPSKLTTFEEFENHSIENKTENNFKTSTKIIKETKKATAPGAVKQQEETPTQKSKTQYYTEDVETKSKTAKQSKVGFFTSIIAVVLLVIISFFLYKTNSSTQEQISEINFQLKETNAKASKAENFIKEHKKLVEFFTYNNIAVANFDRPDKTSNATGKLFISFDKTLGLLMVNNLPELIPGEMYQLWLISRGRSYPVISFIPKNSYNYIHISELPLMKKSEIDMFRITSEKKPNPDIPEGKTVLVGGFFK